MLDTEKLEKVYYSMPNKEASEEMGVSVPTLLKMIDKAGIKRKGSGRPYLDMPYNPNPPVYTSNANEIVNKKCGVLGYALFHMLLLDSEFMSNDWDGQSGIPIEEYGTDYFSVLLDLQNNGFIGDFYTIDKKIATRIINRKGFAMTESEFIKYMDGE